MVFFHRYFNLDSFDVLLRNCYDYRNSVAMVISAHQVKSSNESAVIEQEQFFLIVFSHRISYHPHAMFLSCLF